MTQNFLSELEKFSSVWIKKKFEKSRNSAALKINTVKIQNIMFVFEWYNSIQISNGSNFEKLLLA